MAPVATRTSATHVLPARQGQAPVLLAHVTMLADDEGRKQALVAHLVDVRV